jgi:hypothetical protein
MAISPDMADKYFQAVSERMRTLGLAWAVDQVLDDIGRGKEQFVRFKKAAKKTKNSLPAKPVTEDPRETSGPRGELAARTVDYSPQERLEILLAALQRALVDTSEMQQELVKHYGTIRFIPEQDQANRAFEFLQQSDSEAEAMRKLKGLITDLKEQLK